MATNNEKFRKRLDTLELSRPEAARLMCVSVKTVDSWLAKPEATMYREMSDSRLDHFIQKTTEEV